MISSELRIELVAALDTAINHVNEKLGYGPEHAIKVQLLKKRARYELAKSALRVTRLSVAAPLDDKTEDAAA